MNRIQVLDKTVAELIAAGEVVERPASIVKELLENAIDAGATRISVEIKGGGIGYIRITDNGSGIQVEDIPYAFLRHATSKVSTVDDLSNINTLGFRGEALASIAAVAKIELTTKTKDSLDGWFYEVQGGVSLEIPTPIAAIDGTTFIIRDIFYNVPARMKFLRKDVTEGNAIALVVDKCALSHPEISFQFIRDQKTRLQTSGNGDLKAVIAAVYGREFSNNLIDVDFIFENRIHVTGYIGTPSNSKSTRTYQNFFINNRYVHTRTCSMALEEAFKGKLMVGKFPVCTLFIDLEPSQIDANVHPAKTEIRFTEEKSVYNATYLAIRNALNTTEIPISISQRSTTSQKITPLSIDIDVEPPVQEHFRSSTTPNIKIDDVKPTDYLRFSSPKFIASEKTKDSLTSNVTFNTLSDKMESDPILKQTQPSNFSYQEVTTQEHSIYPLRFIGELFTTYILLESENGELVLVDKHAAHERVKYETIRNNSLAGNRQVLLSTIPVTLSRDEYTILLQNLDILEHIGFLIEDFGMGTILVRETPVILDGQDVSELLMEIASNLLQNKNDLTPEVLNQLYYSIACKSAIRAGDKNSKEELEEIIRLLEENPQITHCPHGRPVSIRLTRYEIEKMFGRLG